MQRVLVVGCPGAGKTTFATRLSAKTGLPVIHLDVHYWGPRWTPPRSDDWRETAARLVEAPEWIMDGNFPDSFDIRMPRADTLVWLDYPRTKCLARVLLRRIRKHGAARADLPPGCLEQFDPALIRFIWTFPGSGRGALESAIAQFGRHLDVARLASDGEAAKFLAAATGRR